MIYKILFSALDYIFQATLAILILILTIPILVWISFKILKEKSGPILFIQTRIGLNGRHFRIYKFRTMTNEAVRHAPFICTSYEDPRITDFGRFLRKKKLDELPQLINVIKGEMRFVGPRPEVPYFHELNSDQIPHWRERISVKPGITGYAQIHPRISHNPNEKIVEDLRYIKNKSFLLDLELMLGTLTAWIKDRII